MKHLHIVEPYHSTAMQRMTSPLSELSKLYKLTSDETPSAEADVNLWVPWHGLADAPETCGKNIAVYTHCNPGAEAQLLKACARADVVTAMSYEGRRELVEMGVDPKKIWVIYASASDFKYSRRIIAIVGYPQPNGRKRESLLMDLAWQYDLSAYEFLFVGAGWEDFANRFVSLGVAAQAFHADTWEALNQVYQRIDALLITGYVEGGPLPLLEAMASGCKVFSPAFGYAADLLTDDDLYITPDDLMQKMNDYFKPRLDNAYLAQAWTWADYVTEYALLIGRLLGESVDLFPNRGMSRYAQLLDIVDEIKPQSIVEIGTWKGDTALRLIQQAAKYRPMEDVFYQGFDLFEKQTPTDLRNELSKGGWIQEIVYRRLNATGAGIGLVGGYTKDTLQEHLRPADFYFVDGGHSEKTIDHDGAFVLGMLEKNPHAVAIFDDYYHEGQPFGMGCNKFIDALNRNDYKVTFLPARTIADDGRVIGMVRVEHATVPVSMSSQTYTYSIP